MIRNEENLDDLVFYDVMVSNEKGDFTVKVFRNKTFSYYATIILETDKYSRMIARTTDQNSMERVKKEAVKFIEDYTNKNKK